MWYNLFIMNFITQKELATKLGVSLQLLNHHIKKGYVKTISLNGMVLVDANTLLKRRNVK